MRGAIKINPRENVVIVCISKEEWTLDIGIPFYCHTDGYKYFPHYPRLKTVERIEYLASRRNAAIQECIKLYPNLQHIFMIDTYYFSQQKQMRELLSEYDGQRILGASTWFIDPSKIPKKRRYWDSWTNPEFREASLAWGGQIKTSGAGGFCLFPRWVWEKQKFGVPYPFPESGCEANYLSRCTGIDTYITFNVKAWREPPEELRDKPFIDRLRTTIGLRTHLRQCVATARHVKR